MLKWRGPSRWGTHGMEMADGGRVAVVGGGPAGSFTAFFLLEMAEHIGLDLTVEVFEAKDFTRRGPAGCNHCGGIVSESLVQMLATEGIVLPVEVVKQAIEGYVLHGGGQSVRIEAPLHEMRIAAVYRGGGPKAVEVGHWQSFDGYLAGLARDRGAALVSRRVTGVSWREGRPMVETGGAEHGPYDLLVGAMGINAHTEGLLAQMGLSPEGPGTVRTLIAELDLGAVRLREVLGQNMHVFLEDLVGLECAALIPKGEFATLVLVGEKADKELLAAFLDSPSMRRLFPDPDDLPGRVCGCRPLMNVARPRLFFADRVALVGDCGVSRLYKDGIGSAYRTAKALAVTALFQGVSAEDFRRHYLPLCRSIDLDNALGGLVFRMVDRIKRYGALTRGVMSMVAREQTRPPRRRGMSMVMWDTFTGSAPYRDILLRATRPAFWFNLSREVALNLAARG